jgi:hypothetical protein
VAALRNKMERGFGAYPDQLSYAICARDEVCDPPLGALAVTADDIFNPA